MKGRTPQDDAVPQDYEGPKPPLVPPPLKSAWFEMAGLVPQPGRLVILRKSESEEETAMWKRSRQFDGKKWQPYSLWISHATKLPIDFQPQAWRPWP